MASAEVPSVRQSPQKKEIGASVIPRASPGLLLTPSGGRTPNGRGPEATEEVVEEIPRHRADQSAEEPAPTTRSCCWVVVGDDVMLLALLSLNELLRKRIETDCIFHQGVYLGYRIQRTVNLRPNLELVQSDPLGEGR
jgi:hypothetical protein